MIYMDHISFAYDREPVLDQICLEIPDGQITALIGPNGSGKSTCLRLCAGLLKPKAGMICVNGANLSSYSPKQLAHMLAYMPQEKPIPAIRVRALVTQGRFPHLGLTQGPAPADRAIIEEALNKVGLADYAERDLRSLSGGQRQKAYLAMLISQGARDLLLDEPTTYLDVLHQIELMDLLRALRNEGHGIAVVLHDLQQAASIADRILLLHQGKLLYSGDQNGLWNSGAIETAFGVRPVRATGIRFERR